MASHSHDPSLLCINEIDSSYSQFAFYNYSNITYISTKNNILIGCAESDIRLLEGSTEYEGRVEICRGNRWNSICYNQWTAIDARVVCRQLGFTTAGDKLSQ